MDALAVATRLGSYIGLSLIAGVPLFLFLSVGANRARAAFASWRVMQASLAALSVGLSVLGLLTSTAAMTGTPVFLVDWSMITLALSVTTSAKVVVIRIVLLLGVLALLLSSRARLIASTLLATAAAATLAWGGHAAAGEGGAGWLHLSGDIIHILAAAVWIGGMACLLMTLLERDAVLARQMLRAFAWIGAVVVGLLVATGVLNTLMTIGIDAIASSLGATYGKLLAVKLALFLIMLGLAANNRFRLTPGFERCPETSTAVLLRAISVEISLGFVILALVAWLGMIDPHGMD